MAIAAGVGGAVAAPFSGAIGNHKGGLRVAGVMLIALGAFLVIGSATGHLAPMIAALFYPDSLHGGAPSSGTPSTSTSSVTTPVGNTQVPQSKG